MGRQLESSAERRSPLNRKTMTNWSNRKKKLGKEIIQLLYEEGMIKTCHRDKPEGWTLASGLWSPFYIQLRPLSSHPILLKEIANAMGKMIKEEAPHVNKLLGVAMAGIPIVSAISVVRGVPSLYSRKLEGVRTLEGLRVKLSEYGEHSMIEGKLSSGDTVAVVDDMVTTLESKLIAIEQLRFEINKRNLHGIQCSDVFVLLDREQGALQSAGKYGIELHSLIPFKSQGLAWLRDKITEQEFKLISDYLRGSENYQKKDE